LAVHGVDRDDPDVPDLLDGLLDLGLVGSLVHQERVAVALQAGVRLLGDHRAHDDVARALHPSTPWSSSVASGSSAASSEAAWSSAPPSAGSESPSSSVEAASSNSWPVITSRALPVNSTRSAYNRSYVERLPG